VKEETKGLAKDIDDELIVALYNLTGKKFLKIKYGLEPMPEDMKPISLEEVKAREELVKKALAGKLVEKSETPAPDKPEGLRQFDIFIGDEYFMVEVAEKGEAPRVVKRAPAPARLVQTAAAAPAPAPAPKPAAAEAPKPAPPASGSGTAIPAPMPGMFVKYDKQIGDHVEVGDNVLVLEAMKMYNNIPSPLKGTVVATPFSSGDTVAKGDALIVIKAD